MRRSVGAAQTAAAQPAAVRAEVRGADVAALVEATTEALDDLVARCPGTAYVNCLKCEGQIDGGAVLYRCEMFRPALAVPALRKALVEGRTQIAFAVCLEHVASRRRVRPRSMVPTRPSDRSNLHGVLACKERVWNLA